MNETEPSPAVLALVGRADGPREPRIVPLPGGANNRVHCVEGGGQRILLKAYFRDVGDPRDRLATEFEFLRFAWDAGIRSVPEPLVRDEDAGLALYEYIDGEAFTPGEIGAADVDQAAEFLEALNDPAARTRAAHLPAASEAFFSIPDLVGHVSDRVGRLTGIVMDDRVDEDCDRFVAERLLPDWDAIVEATNERIAEEPSLAGSLPDAERVISPSDFGFHNALRVGERIRFFDFEYAGWDDPAKLVCDFFSQVAVPVPGEHLGRMLDAASAFSPNPEGLEERVRRLLPIHRMKWCCILLNDFVDPGRKRRTFALGETAARERRAGQLEKTRQFANSPLAVAR